MLRSSGDYLGRRLLVGTLVLVLSGPPVQAWAEAESIGSGVKAKAATEPKEPKAEPGEAEPEKPKAGAKLESFLEQSLQLGDDGVATPLETVTDPKKVNERKTLAHYMSGRILEREKKYQEAYDAYRKALELNPESSTLYKSLIPLAFRLKKGEAAIEMAQKAVELDPDNFELLSQLGIYSLRQQDLQRSIDYFQRAVQSETVDKKSGPYISILSQLGQLYISIGDNEKAADAYEVVFRALSHPEEYNIDFRTTQALETMRGTKAETLEVFGELFLLTNRLELATSAFNKAREATRGGSQAVFSYQIARVLTKQKEYAQALEKLQEYFSAKQSQKGRGPYLLLAELLSVTDRGGEITAELVKLAAEDTKNEELQLYLAERYLQEEQLDAAEKIYQQYVETGKNKGEIYLGLLQIQRKRENAEQALQSLTLAMMNGASTPRLEAELERLAQNQVLADAMIKLGLEAEDGDTDRRQLFSQAYLLAKLAIQRKNSSAVVDFYQRAMEIRKEPQIQLTLYNELVQFLVSEKKYDECAAVLEEAIDKPELVNTRQALQLKLIEVLAQAKRTEAALEVVEKARESDPDNLRWVYQEGWVHYAVENWEEAIRVFAPLLEKAVEQENEQLEREIRYNLCRAMAFAEMPKEAVLLIEQSLEKEPESLFWTYQKGWVYYTNDNWEEAIKVFQPLLEKAIAQDNKPIEREVRYNLSRVLAFVGQSKEAIQLMEQSLEQEPEELLWLFQKGWINYYTRQWGPAIEVFKELIAKGDGKSQEDRLVRQARFSLSAAYVQNEQLDEGEKVLEEVYEQDPEDTSVCNDLGYLYADRNKNLEQAHEMITKALAADPENQAYLDSMGWVLYRLQRYEEAVKYLQQAIEDSEKGDAVIWDHLGDCYQKLNQPEKAKEAWNTAAEHERGEKFPNAKLLKQIEEKLKP